MSPTNDISISKILMGSSKAELLDHLATDLENADKVIVILVEDIEDGYTVRPLTLGFEKNYEILGILDTVSHDLKHEVETYRSGEDDEDEEDDDD